MKNSCCPTLPLHRELLRYLGRNDLCVTTAYKNVALLDPGECNYRIKELGLPYKAWL